MNPEKGQLRARQAERIAVYAILLCLSLQMSLTLFQTIDRFLLGTPFVFTATVIVFHLFASKERQGSFRTGAAQDKHRSISSFLAYFAIIFFGSAFYWLAYFPGGFNLDAYGQWMQAHGTLPYNNWHPVVSTLLIQLCTSIYDNFAFCICVQIIVFSLSSAQLLRVLEKYGISRKLLLITAAWLGWSPSVGLNSICLTKDVQFTILVVNLMWCSIEILYSEGAWMHSWLHAAFFGILSALTVLVRHNGLLYVAPLLLLLLCYAKSRRHTAVMTVCVIAAVLLVRGPLFSALDVEPHDNATGEMIGIPMAIMGNALVHDTEHLPDDVHAFLNQIADDDAWKAEYITGEWDSCKWVFDGVEILKDTPLKTILSLTGETIAACPQISYESVWENTKNAWHPVQTEPYWVPEEYIAENDVGIAGAAIPAFHAAAEYVKQISLFPIVSALIWNTGLQLALALLIMLAKRKSSIWKTGLLTIPLFVYALGTMLLLAGPNQRYFYCVAVLFLPVILAVWNRPCEKWIEYE